MIECSQCGKPAIVRYGDLAYCVEHHLKMQQAAYLQTSMLDTQLNFVRAQIEETMGIPGGLSRTEIPRPPFIGDNLTLNNINVSKSTIGAINTGTIQHLDASITLMQSQGETDLAATIQELTEAILASNEINESSKNEIAEQLAFLAAQATAEPKNRSIGVTKSILTTLKDSLSSTASLLTIWSKAEPFFWDLVKLD